MRVLYILIISIFAASCHFDIKVKRPVHEKYFDKNTRQLYQAALAAYNQNNFIAADSLFSEVISQSKDKLNKEMPMDLNPYYFRGHLKIGFGQYEAALRDFDKVASDTTSDTDILLARSEAYRMLRKYDSSIAVCNKLLELGYEPSVVLTQRGINYLSKSMKSEACHDFSEAKKFVGADLSYIDSLLLKCE